MSSDRLKCYEKCPFRGLSIIRPCSKEVFENNSGCKKNIAADPVVQKLGAVTPTVTMDNLMNNEVDLRIKVEEGTKSAGLVNRGVVNRPHPVLKF